MRIILVLLLISGCKTAGPDVSEPEFMTFAQDDPHLWNIMELLGANERYLVKKVHEKSWDIDYGFAPNCSENKREQLRPRVIEAIHRVVNLWLNPIRAMRKAIKDGRFNSDPIIDHQKPPPALVSKFNIHEKEVMLFKKINQQKLYSTFNLNTIMGKLEKGDSEGLDLLLQLPELSVVFNCNKGRAVMQPRFNTINIYQQVAKTNIPETEFPFATLLHEVGHTFGLADTYVDPQHPMRDHMVSSGGSIHTVGHQPISVMGPHPFLFFTSYDDVKPTIDDRNGIFWLYAYIHMNKLNLDTCPPGYQKELFERDKEGNPTIACRPKNPLLFAMASRNYSTARAVINDKNTSIDINARTHEQGFTALHYAVLFAPIELIETILKIFSKDIDFSIAGSDLKGLQPMTPLELANGLLKSAQQANSTKSIERHSDVVKLLVKYHK